jgi:tight adherence protein C
MSDPFLMMLGVFSLSMFLTAAGQLYLLNRERRRRSRVFAMQRSAGLQGLVDPVGNDASLLDFLAAVGRLLSQSGLLPASTLSELELNLNTAGFRQSNALAIFIATKVILALFLPLIAFLLFRGLPVAPFMRSLLIGSSAVAGLLGPDVVLRRRRQAHIKGVEKGLADALDMLVICSEAGLGLEAGLDRVATEIGNAHPAVAYEFKITSTELRIMSDRRAALTNLGTRTGLPVMRRLGVTLVQTMQYGTPLSHALRTLATEMRYEMQMRFEAQAARLPVLLTLPMILFILPCIFVVVAGPAGLTVARTLLHH